MFNTDQDFSVEIPTHGFIFDILIFIKDFLSNKTGYIW